MGSPVRPEPDSWLLDDLRRRVQPEPRQLGPQSPFAPADASAVRQRPAPKTLADYGHTAKQILGGVVEGATRLPTDLLGLIATPVTAGPESGSLQTVGRGEVRPSAQPSMGSVVRPKVEGLLHTGEDVARRAGDAAAGGVPENISDESFRQIGDLAGNVAAWEAGARLPKMLRGLRASEAEAVAPRAARPDPYPIIEAHPLELPPEGLSFEEQQAWRRRMVARRMGKPEGTGEARGYANASGQEMLDNHLRQQGLGRYVDRSRGGLLDLLPTLDERGAVGASGEIPARRKFSSASIRLPDGTVFNGATHADAVNAALDAGRTWGTINAADHGFTTHNGRFLTREEATRALRRPEWNQVDAESDMGNPRGGLLSDESGRIGVFHGSPHKFPPEPEHPLGRFDISKIGTGEGAQAYGHGLYFAGDEAVAKYYRDALTPRPEIRSITLGDRRVGQHNGFDYNPRGNSTEENIRSSLFEDLLIDEPTLAQKHDAGTLQQHVLGRLDERIAQMATEWPEGVDAAKRLRAKLAKPGAVKAEINAETGALYRAEIDAEPEHFLDWDKPLSEQSAYVQDRIAQGLDDAGLDAVAIRTGGDYYNYLSEQMGAQEASKHLRELGIPGNRYLDSGSRGVGEGSHNYVVFSDEPIKITGREGVGGANILGGMTAGGVTGAAGGAQIGDTPEERLQNSLLGLGGGMILGGALGHVGGSGARRATGLLDMEAGAVGEIGPGSLGADGKYILNQPEIARRRADPVVAAAMRLPNGTVVTGPNHGMALDNAVEAGHITPAEAEAAARRSSRAPMFDEGFVTKSGQYLTRRALQEEMAGRRPVAELMQLGGLLDRP